jgi:hypothetical protein
MYFLTSGNMNKLIIATIATAIFTVAWATVTTANQVLAFPGENGQGHTKQNTETCTQTQSGDISTGDCSGQSEKSPNKDEVTCTTTFAGKSSNIKDQQCTPPQ